MTAAQGGTVWTYRDACTRYFDRDKGMNDKRAHQTDDYMTTRGIA